MIRAIFIMVLVGLFHAGLAGAQTPSEVASFKKWSAYKLKQDRGTACYLATQPSSSRPKGVKRSAIWLFVTHRPFDKVRDEVSLHMGYPLKKDSNVVVEIDGRKKYDLFGHGETAWAKTREIDRDLVVAMRKGATMVVRGVSKRDTKTTDTYSLSGFTRAHGAIGKACPGK